MNKSENGGKGLLTRVRRLAFAGVLATGTAMALPALTTAASAATPVCPAVGAASDCGVLITINANGTVSIVNEGNGNPYDGNDDTLVGIVNNSSVALSSIVLTSSLDIFAVDGDGICTYPCTGDSYCSSLPKGSYGYEGPDNTFSNIASNKRTGTVNFTGGLAAGSSTYFSLENNLANCSGGSDTQAPQVASRATTAPCVSVGPGSLTVDKVDNTGKALTGAKFTVYTNAAHTGTSMTCDASTTGTCTLSNLAAGEYWVDETTTPSGYKTAAEQTAVILGNAVTLTFTDTPVPVVPVSPSGGTTTTTTTTTAPAQVAGATTVHTGEDFAGSLPYELAVVGAGIGILGAGLIRRRRARAARR